MRLSRLFVPAALAIALTLPVAAGPQRNVVIFVADGLRYTAVTPQNAPTMYRLKTEGVDFSNSHSAYPTLTTVNASVIATGHYPGDTGNYGNTLYLAKPVECLKGAVIAFVENDCVLREVKSLYPDDYIAQATLLQTARASGMNAVVVGKLGPSAIQFLAALDTKGTGVDDPVGLLIDDNTNIPAGHDGSPTRSTMLTKPLADDIAKITGALSAPPEAAAPNIVQQAYLRQAVTQVILPRLKESGKPFAMLYWSRDPDTTHHRAEDSAGKLNPGINSINNMAAIYNADNDLKGILEALKQQGLDANTDVFVIADHGFSTIAKGIPTPDGRVERFTLASGFLAMDVAGWLSGKLFDPDRDEAELDLSSGEHPKYGSGLIGPSADKPDAIVVGNGGSDFIYVPSGDRAIAKKIFAKLVEQPYVGALFVNDAFIKGGPESDFAGALPMSRVNLIGSSRIPQAAIVVGFRTFVMHGCKQVAEMCQAEVADASYPSGQGMHGSFGRGDTRNFMAAIGPDFKKRYAAKAPVGNVDVAPTLAHILGLELKGPGVLKGRVIEEALVGGKAPKVVTQTLSSAKAPNGFHTEVNMQQVGDTRYFTAGGMPGRAVGLVAK